jgi:hypothetical protein
VIRPNLLIKRSSKCREAGTCTEHWLGLVDSAPSCLYCILTALDIRSRITPIFMELRSSLLCSAQPKPPRKGHTCEARFGPEAADQMHCLSLPGLIRQSTRNGETVKHFSPPVTRYIPVCNNISTLTCFCATCLIKILKS